ncbi:MAG: 1-acyl-sn-glycerol-3-phosphate acyltransferase [Myxococcales bacterium]|nr:1-acyl-sn-glycerol-3-phosphate acyltransferase [Myxococcales bacterium]
MTTRGDHSSLSARGARAALRALGGWRFVGEIPEPRRAVCLATPHTDNMDGLLLVLLAKSVGMTIKWMVKDAWVKPPIGYLIRGVGGVPVDRTRANGMVGQMAEEFARLDDFYLAIPPEGTRGRTEYWKSGFYRIALEAGVPVVPGFLDYGKKEGGFGPALTMTGDVRADMDAIRAFYEQKKPTARHPEKFGPIRLREETKEGE